MQLSAVFIVTVTDTVPCQPALNHITDDILIYTVLLAL